MAQPWPGGTGRPPGRLQGRPRESGSARPIRLDWAGPRSGWAPPPTRVRRRPTCAGVRLPDRGARPPHRCTPSPRAGASTWSCGPTWRRRWPGAGGYDQLPATLPGPRGRPHRRPAAAPPGRGGPGRHGRDRGPDLPVPVPGRPRPLGLPAGDPRRQTCGGQPAVGGGARAAHHPAARLAEVARRNLARGLDGIAVYELGAVFLPTPIRGRDAQWPSRASRTWGSCWPGRRRRPLRRPPAAVRLRRRQGRGRGAGGRPRGPGVGFRGEEPLPYHPGRCAAVLLGDEPVGVLASSTRGSRPPASCPRPRSRSSWSWTRCWTAVPRMRPASTPSPYPSSPSTWPSWSRRG
jgi:hypothetical protein